jgi:hypothetical protein
VTRFPNLGVGGRLEGRFFFQAVFGVDSGLSSVHLDMDFPCKFFLGGGGEENLFSFQAMGRPKVPCFYSFQVWRAGRIFFFHFALFPNVFPWCSL